MRRTILSCAVISISLSLVGCFGGGMPAPVVNAWYRPHGATNAYVVRAGDTIYSIAWAFGLDYRSLVAANKLPPPYVLHVGQRLVMTGTPAGMFSPSVMENTRHIQRVAQSTGRVQGSQILSSQAIHRWQWPVQGHVIERFSLQASGRPGIGIAARLGASIKAAANGVVVYSGDGVRGYGNLIILKHNNRYLSAYGFNERNLVSVGEHVRAGSVIARMGKDDAGRTLLYFEIRRDGKPVNPMIFLR